MSNRIILLVFLFFGLWEPSLRSQVINTERLRMEEEQGWSGSVGADFSLRRNKAGQTVGLGAQGNLQWVQDRNTWMLFGAYQLTQFLNIDVPGSAPKNFANNRFLHLRYNRELATNLKLESFVQYQVDEIQEIEIRMLGGIGLRYQLIESDSFQLALGALGMAEYEASNEPEFTATHRHFRWSHYLSFSWQPRPWLEVTNITYFQPRVDRWSDFRISSETQLGFRVTDTLSLTNYLLYIFDARPPASVPEVMFSLRNGLRVDF